MKRTFLLTFFTVTLLTMTLANLFAKGRGDQAAPVESGVQTTSSTKPDLLRVASLNGPSSLPMAAFFETHPDLDGVASDFSVVATPDVLLPALLKGDVDMGVLPINAAAKVYT